MALINNLANLAHKLVGKLVNELNELLAHPQHHISDVILPVGYRVRHRIVIQHHFLGQGPDLLESRKTLLKASVDVVDLFLVDQTLDAGIALLFFLPKVQR